MSRHLGGFVLALPLLGNGRQSSMALSFLYTTLKVVVRTHRVSVSVTGRVHTERLVGGTLCVS